MSSEVVLKRLISIGKSKLKSLDGRKSHGLRVPLLLYQSLEVWYSKLHEIHELKNMVYEDVPVHTSPIDEDDEFEYLEWLTEFSLLLDNGDIQSDALNAVSYGAEKPVGGELDDFAYLECLAEFPVEMDNGDVHSDPVKVVSYGVEKPIGGAFPIEIKAGVLVPVLVVFLCLFVSWLF